MQYILTHHVVEDGKTQEMLHSIVSCAVALQDSLFKTAHMELHLVITKQDAIFKNFLLVAMNHPTALQETYASEVVIVQKKEGLNSVAKDFGVQLLHLHGVYLMQWWFVGSLDMLGNVSIYTYNAVIYI